MKNEKVFKTPGVLLLGQNNVADLSHSTPVGLLRVGPRVIGRLLGMRSPDAPLAADHERAFRDAVERSRKFREMIHQRATTPYVITAISHCRYGADK